MSVSSKKGSSGPERVVVKRALISLSDKTGAVEFAQALVAAGAEILSTGGTARALKEAGLPVKDVSEVTGFPEIMDGRVKTLHPAVHGGILAIRDDSEHQAAMQEHEIEPIDLVAINLYPFEETAAKSSDPLEIIENIDIGGPAMIRAAAKNAAFVAVVTDPADYGRVAEAVASGGVDKALRRELAAKAFARTGAYDAAISGWFAEQSETQFPERMVFAATRASELRYGENPHQKAALYSTDKGKPGAANACLVNGKPLSYNNLSDADAAFQLAADLDPERPAIAIIKHANPCGVAVADTLAEAHAKALICDPVSAYGGVVAANRQLDEAAAKAITALFTEVVIAPDADEAALKILKAKANLRVLLTGSAMPATGMMVKSIAGGLLVQEIDAAQVKMADLKVVTKREPTEQELADLIFAFRICKHVKSNAIVYAKDGAAVGIGAGQMSRVDSARIAAWKAQEATRAAGLEDALTRGSVVASDAFFPFADGLLAAAEAGATAVIQPGGSLRDQEVIDAADEAGLAMVFTGLRHFRH
ncbi:bifunctional phosphoribosylaminoimidazolecarboxamide formyltransferase/IMP cyclohydrolase [Afifella aestuarii]|uniref:bifunctional phosphoribosylaminoimidazolecarboxamide formyltransferase/IMP cyclohydrolase n=1 Tax=Afifella aestuarii TaxID=1909496 RepID=UPI000FE2E2B0|nr:bifunctional phosphoribosylaminoimidazolecarboxamide formyltransferase/IMP cyclohydrolase [Afifella aestuarii]